MSEIDQIRAAHKAAMPKPQENPAWANTHHDLGVVLDALEARDKTIAELVEALTPFSDAVFNDNGDITVNFGSPEPDDFFRAYSAIRRISQAQSKDKAE